jgi:hypothetical protein
MIQWLDVQRDDESNESAGLYCVVRSALNRAQGITRCGTKELMN